MHAAGDASRRARVVTRGHVQTGTAGGGGNLIVPRRCVSARMGGGVLGIVMVVCAYRYRSGHGPYFKAVKP